MHMLAVSCFVLSIPQGPVLRVPRVLCCVEQQYVEGSQMLSDSARICM